MLRADAIRKFGLRREDIATLPSMKSVPGYYSPREMKCRTRLTLLDHDAAREAGIAVHGSIDAMVQHASKMTSKKLDQYGARKALHRADSPKPRRPRSEDAFEMGIRLIPNASWGLFVHRCSILVRDLGSVSFIVLHVDPIIMIDRSIGDGYTQRRVSRVILGSVERLYMVSIAM